VVGRIVLSGVSFTPITLRARGWYKRYDDSVDMTSRDDSLSAPPAAPEKVAHDQAIAFGDNDQPAVVTRLSDQ
jgi:hypothetical protein